MSFGLSTAFIVKKGACSEESRGKRGNPHEVIGAGSSQEGLHECLFDVTREDLWPDSHIRIPPFAPVLPSALSAAVIGSMDEQ